MLTETNSLTRSWLPPILPLKLAHVHYDCLAWKEDIEIGIYHDPS